MNFLFMGAPFGADNGLVSRFRSNSGHAIRTLSTTDTTDYRFEPRETATDVVDRIGRDWPVDALLCWLPELFPPPLEIERCPAMTIAAVSDWNIYYPQLEHNLARYDLVLMDKLGANTLTFPEVQPRFFFPLYSQRSDIHRDHEVARDIDVLFVGTLNHAVHQQRGRLIEDIALNLADRYRVVVASNCWDDAYARLLSRARIVFNHSVRREMNLRCFETLACGALLFLEEENLEAGGYLHENKDVVFYQPDNLVALLEQYLEDEPRRSRMAAKGHAKAPALAGEARLNALLDFIASQGRGPRAFTTFDAETRTLAEIMQYGASLDADQRAYAAQIVNAACGQYARNPGMLLAKGCMAVERAAKSVESDRKELAREAIAVFQAAAKSAPEAAVPWLNLAYVSRSGAALDAEAACLKRALACTSAAHGGLLLGSPNERYYAAWRRALALREDDVDILHATAANQLALCLLGKGDLAAAAGYAERAVALMPDIAPAHITRAKIHHAAGDLAAEITALERALPLTAFDFDLRKRLEEAYALAGHPEKAARQTDELRRLRAVLQI